MDQVNFQRTQEEYSKQEYNYFLYFQIDLTETDPKKLEETIKKKLCNTSGLGRRMLELKNDCLEILCNDAIFENGQYVPQKGGRKMEADRAREFKRREAREVVENICRTRKNLLKSEIVDICNTVNRPINFFETNEFINSITTYLDGLGVKIIDNTDSSMPFKKFEDVEKLLGVLCKADLYEFLGKDQSASVAELKQASDEIYANGQKSGDLKKKQSISKICGNINELLLQDAKTRQAYDQYLVLKEPVWADFEQRKKCGVDIQVSEYEDYVLTVGTLLNVSLDEAKEMIAIGCKYYCLEVFDGLGVKIIDNIDSSIPFKKFEEVEKLLEGSGTGRTDLYGFLGKDQSASVAELKQASDEIYANGQKSGDLKKKQSISKICGNINELLLQDAKTRQAYDQYLVLKEPVWTGFEQRRKYGIDLWMDEYEAYVQTVVSLLNVSVDEAEKMIAIGCQYYKISCIRFNSNRNRG